MVTTVIVAVVTARYFSVQQSLVAVNTAQLTVDLVKLQPGNAVAEVLLTPTTVAISAITAEFADFSASRVTGAASQTLMKPVERPVTVSGVGKGRLLTDIVALFARISPVAVIAHRVYLFVRLVDPRGFIQVMAVTAIFLRVTVDASQSE